MPIHSERSRPSWWTLAGSWPSLVAGTLLLAVAGYQTTVPAAAWLAPLLLLAWSRSARSGRVAYLGVAAAYALALGFGFRGGLVPLPTGAIVGLALGSGLVRALGYAADRWLARLLGPLGPLGPIGSIARSLSFTATSAYPIRCGRKPGSSCSAAAGPSTTSGTSTTRPTG